MPRTYAPSGRGPAVSVSQDPRGRRGADTPGFGAGLGALSDILTGGVRGAAAATLGLPGDLEKLLRGLYGAASAGPQQDRLGAGLQAAERSWAPSTEDWKSWLPGPTEFSIPAEQNAHMQVAEFGAMSPAQAARVVGGLGRMARPVAAGLGRVGAEALRRGVEEARGPLAQVGQAIAPQYAVRPRGGNFSTPSLARYLTGEGGWADGITEGALEPTQGWAKTQLANYIKRDLGAPTDPLLALEAELPNLHFASEDPMEMGRMTLMNDAGLVERNPHGPVAQRQAEHARLTGGQPLTPWGQYSGDMLNYSSPEDYARDLIGGMPARSGMSPFESARAQGHNVDWLEKAPADTKIWGLDAPDDDALGFKHVLDYLDAAQNAHSTMAPHGGPEALRAQWNQMEPDAQQFWQRGLALHDAGLTLNPDSLGRLSVPDAVRKTAAWNKLLEEGMGGPQNPDLLKGIKAVHKEYPEDGMRWVELGQGDLPEGWHQAKDSLGVDTVYGPDGYSTMAGSIKDPRTESLRAGLNAEGDVMGHCVGGYCRQVQENGTKIYSLRDKNGNPHVTVEARPRQADHADMDRWAQANPAEFEALMADANQNRGNALPMWRARYPDVAQSQDIVQIKGKQNAAPVAKYLPYVQDFVKGGQWGKVGDLQNTGLKTLNERGVPDGFGRFSFANPTQQAQIWQQAGIDPAQTKYLDDGDMKKLTGAYDAFAKGRVPVKYGNDKLLEMLKRAKNTQDYDSVQGLYTPGELRQAYADSARRGGGQPNQQDLQFLHSQIRNAVPGDWRDAYFNPDVMPDDFYAPFDQTPPAPGYAAGGAVQPRLTPFMQRAQAMLAAGQSPAL